MSGTGAELASQRPDIEPTVADLPIQLVGQQDPLNPDRNLGYPNILYHGTKEDAFALDETRNHRQVSSGIGARAGRGLYTGSEQTSKKFGYGNVVELVPKDAALLDLDAPEASAPLSDEFRAAYIEDYDQNARERVMQHFAERLPDVNPRVVDAIWSRLSTSEDFITREDTRAIASKALGTGKTQNFREGKAVADEIAAQINTARMIQDPDTSVRELFATADPINGQSRAPANIAFDFAPTIDFLTSQGIDGALTAQRFDGEQGVVLWKLDHVGDHETWERRAQANDGILPTTSMSRVETTASDEASSTAILEGPATIDSRMSQKIFEDVSEKRAIAPKDKLDAVAQKLAGEKVDPLEIVKDLAAASPELRALLAGTTGVNEGYRLHEHTQAVLGRFEKEYAHRLDPKDRQLIRTGLMLQDIGKSLAVARRGDKEKQTVYNKKVAENILNNIDENILTKDDKLFVYRMIGQDIVGGHLQSKTTLAEAKGAYQALVSSVPQVHQGRVGRAMQIMNMCDASAYTSEASFVRADGTRRNARGSLDRLFTRNQRNNLSLAEPYRSRAKAITA